MSNFKGTKGKWETSNEGISNGVDLEGCISIISSCDMHWDICAVWDDLKNREGKANALLISKAPEMLEVLQKIVLMTEICKGDFNDFKERYNIEIKQLIKEATEL